MGVQPFTLSVSDADLELLRKKLEITRFPDEVEGAGWDYGVQLADVQRLVARWKDGYDWRAAEAKINEIPQFTTNVKVDGFGTLNVHFVHQRSEVKNAIPLLFVHGCESGCPSIQRKRMLMLVNLLERAGSLP